MYKDTIEMFLLLVDVIPKLLMAVIERATDRYARERVEAKTRGACECTTWRKLEIRLHSNR